MNVGAILYARLSTDAAVANLVESRIEPEEIGQETTLPALAYQVTLADESEGTAPMRRASISIYCQAHTEPDAHNLAVAVDAALSNYAARSGTTRTGPLQRAGWEYLRDHELNIWQVRLTYQTWVVF
jgi:hypothetical protein